MSFETKLASVLDISAFLSAALPSLIFLLFDLLSCSSLLQVQPQFHRFYSNHVALLRKKLIKQLLVYLPQTNETIFSLIVTLSYKNTSFKLRFLSGNRVSTWLCVHAVFEWTGSPVTANLEGFLSLSLFSGPHLSMTWNSLQGFWGDLLWRSSNPAGPSGVGQSNTWCHIENTVCCCLSGLISLWCLWLKCVVLASLSSFQPSSLLLLLFLLLPPSSSEECLRGELGLWLLEGEAGGGPGVLREHCFSL